MVTDYPAIIIVSPKVSAQYVSTGYGRLYQFSCDIFPLLVHEDRKSNLANVAQLCDAIMRILNSPPYEELPLESGTVLYRAQCTVGEADDSQVSDNKFAATGQISWSADAFIIDTLQGIN